LRESRFVGGKGSSANKRAAAIAALSFATRIDPFARTLMISAGRGRQDRIAAADVRLAGVVLSVVQGEALSVQQGSRRLEACRIEPANGAGLRYPGFGALFVIWTAIGALTSARHYYLTPSRPETVDVAQFLACVVYLYPWVGLSPLVFRLEERFPLGPQKWTRHLAVLAGWSVPVCLVASLMMVIVLAVFAWWAPVSTTPSVFFVLALFPIAEAAFWSSVAGGYFVRTLFQLQEQERRTVRLALEKSQLEAGLNQAQLEVLRARLNPHFLFNSLQNISVMIGQDPQTASRMVTRLGDLLRAVLRQDSRPETTLQEEIALTGSYVALERMRFADRLNVGFEIAADTQEALVPSFLLQPLIENAVVHGLRGVHKTGIITVSTSSQDGELVLTVTDNGNGLPVHDGAELKVGVGLGSTCERLARMYPDSHTFSIQRSANGGAEVRITIPLRFAAGEDRASHDEQLTGADR
jgi:two-component system, LytTR family, sensor kinase